MPVDREHLFPAAAVSNLALGTASTSSVVLRTGDLVLSSKSSIKIKLFLDTLFEFLSLSPPPPTSLPAFSGRFFSERKMQKICRGQKKFSPCKERVRFRWSTDLKWKRQS